MPKARVLGRAQGYDAFRDDAEAEAGSAAGSVAPGGELDRAPDTAGQPEATAADVDEVATLGQLGQEFLQAVGPMTIFVVLYIGVLLGEWIITPIMGLSLISVVIGLAIFKWGLLMGLMPFGKEIGTQLPSKVHTCVMAQVLFTLGLLVTYSEPGINSLQIVGGIMEAGGTKGLGLGPRLLLRLLSNERSFYLLTAVACGVGLAAVAGVQRLQWHIGIKPVIVACLLPTMVMTAYCWLGPDQEALRAIVGLSWDCGAITTGPATVPIVLSLGMGVAHSNGTAGELDGFGIVTLASLLPVLTVLVFGVISRFHMKANAQLELTLAMTSEETRSLWAEFPLLQAWESLRAMGPLVVLLVLIQSLLIREVPGSGGRGRGPKELARGILAALTGLYFFNVGLRFGSMPLGQDAGAALANSLTMYSPENGYPSVLGLAVLMCFGFVAGFIATIIDLEPCGLGEAVENLSKGAFTKRDLFASVASGVGVGIMLGFAKVLFGLDLFAVLLVGYGLALILTIFADEGLCCVAWDSAGVTTGPVTVPLVLSMGVSLCNKVGATDGFGILACASVCPIIAVLFASILRTRVCPRRLSESKDKAPVQVGEPEESPAGVEGDLRIAGIAESGGPSFALEAEE